MPYIGLEGTPVNSSAKRTDEDECIQLLEDCALGRLIFVVNTLNLLFLPVWLIPLTILNVIIIAILNDADVTEWPSKLMKLFKWVALTFLYPAYLVIWVYRAVFWLDEACLPVPVLIYLLKEVEFQSSRDIDINWRQIAYSANELSWEIDGTEAVFHGGDHCMKYFNKHIVGAVRNGSYEIDTVPAQPTFGNEKSHKDLLIRSVESYQRSTEAAQEAYFKSSIC